MFTGWLAGGVDQLKGDHLLAGELEHGQAGAIADVNATGLAVPERDAEVEGGGQVGDTVRRMEGLRGRPYPGYELKPGKSALLPL